MYIVLSHLTRMKYPYVCLAGFAIKKDRHGQFRIVRPLRHVRPLAPWRWGVQDVAASSLAIGSLLVLDGAVPKGKPPEVEDVSVQSLSSVRLGDAGAFWAACKQYAQPSLADIFGVALDEVQGLASLPFEQGQASLGIFKPAQPIDLYITEEGKLRLRLIDAMPLSLAVTDLRLYRGEGHAWQPALEVITALRHRLQAGEPALLSVGVGRAFPLNDPEREPRHWVQVNNIHLEHDPLWTPETILIN